MAHEVILPKQGQSVETCLILGWKKKIGDPVQEGEALVEVETDKATFEIPAPASGTLLAVYHEQGEDVPVLTPLALIGQPGEAVASAPQTAQPGSSPMAASAASSTASLAPAGAPASPPASAMPADAATAAGAGSDSAVAGKPIPSRAGGRVAISPRARRLAERSGWNAVAAASALPQGRGSGPGGRILERDVRQALQARGPKAPAARAPATSAPAARVGPGFVGKAPAEDFPGPITEIPVKGIRKVIAERMLASLAGSAQYTLHAWANAEILTAYRKRLKESDESLGLRGITIGDLVNYAAARTLAAHPEANAHFLEGRIAQFAHVHLGFAVDTPRGLLVPVIRNADSLSLRRLAAEAARLTQACLEGTAGPEALSGGTFTVSNLGAMGVEHFTPVLNPPQVAILGVGTIALRPVAAPANPGGVLPREAAAGKEAGASGVVFLPHIALSLTANHQALDGAPAARLLAELARNIENIGLLLAG
jgi:pyruvate dehydrogenase E2 component (dihydrolipoamide acetyltransferase)